MRLTVSIIALMIICLIGGLMIAYILEIISFTTAQDMAIKVISLGAIALVLSAAVQGLMHLNKKK